MDRHGATWSLSGEKRGEGAPRGPGGPPHKASVLGTPGDAWGEARSIGGAGTAGYTPSVQPGAARVQQALKERGFDFQVVEMPASTRTAQEAAAAVGCALGQIAKSLIFRGHASGAAILVIASGSNRVNEQMLAELAGEPIGRADAAFVHSQTGFAIGGVPPVGHITPLKTFIDPDLLRYPTIWAAAGTRNALFALDPKELGALTGGVVAAIA